MRHCQAGAWERPIRTYLLGGITVFSINAETGNGFLIGIRPELFDAR